MPKTLTAAARRELIEVVRARYRHSTTPEKRFILREFIAITGYHRKSAIRALNRSEPDPVPTPRTSRRIYDEVFRRTLVVLWNSAGRPCGKRLYELLPALVAEFAQQGRVTIDRTVRQKLETVSAATIDRLLQQTRIATRPPRQLTTDKNRHCPDRVVVVESSASAHVPCGVSMDSSLTGKDMTGHTPNDSLK